jgi:hypothetical protein
MTALTVLESAQKSSYYMPSMYSAVVSTQARMSVMRRRQCLGGTHSLAKDLVFEGLVQRRRRGEVYRPAEQLSKKPPETNELEHPYGSPVPELDKDVDIAAVGCLVTRDRAEHVDVLHVETVEVGANTGKHLEDLIAIHGNHLS